MFAGYLYFHKAPNPEEMQEELKDKISNLYLFDCLRANKGNDIYHFYWLKLYPRILATSAWGVEARVPFLDADFLDVAMTIDPGSNPCRIWVTVKVFRDDR